MSVHRDRMSAPITVLAVMLVDGRPAMVQRAIRCFQAQTHKLKRLLIYDSGAEPVTVMQGDGIYYDEVPDSVTIGMLRNRANGYAVPECLDCQIIMHWDSDDWSHPQRMTEQVELLEASGKRAVGYRNMLFWDQRECGRAWLYSNNDPRYCLGTSLCYWRSAWEARPFADEPKRRGGPGEDVLWLSEVASLGVPSFPGPIDSLWEWTTPYDCRLPEYVAPRMFASIHAGNTQAYDLVVGQSPSWRRMPECDQHCREVMAL